MSFIYELIRPLMCISLTYFIPYLPSTLYENKDLSRDIASGFYCSVSTTTRASDSSVPFKDW
jgi:hypothetical protein